MAIIMMVLVLTAGTEAASAEDLIYAGLDRYWKEDGTSLVINGTFYSFLDDWDICSLKNLEFELIDREENVIGTVEIEDEIKLQLPHNGAADHSIMVTDIEDGEATYGTGLFLKLVSAEYDYYICEGSGCPYCSQGKATDIDPSVKDDDPSVVCNWCGGSKKCEDCGGTGKIKRKKYGIFNSSYEATEKCVLCNGTGVCYKCQGKGYTK